MQLPIISQYEKQKKNKLMMTQFYHLSVISFK